MTDENPAAGPRYMPSNSTTIGTLGGAGLSPLIIWALNTYTHANMPAEVAASAGAFIGNLIGYFFEGGRKS